jgi:hypothetical protein
MLYQDTAYHPVTLNVIKIPVNPSQMQAANNASLHIRFQRGHSVKHFYFVSPRNIQQEKQSRCRISRLFLRSAVVTFSGHRAQRTSGQAEAMTLTAC